MKTGGSGQHFWQLLHIPHCNQKNAGLAQDPVDILRNGRLIRQRFIPGYMGPGFCSPEAPRNRFYRLYGNIALFAVRNEIVKGSRVIVILHQQKVAWQKNGVKSKSLQRRTMHFRGLYAVTGNPDKAS